MGSATENSTSAAAIAAHWLFSFQKACLNLSQASEDRDAALNSVVAHFLPNGWWRDALCLSWDYRTHEGVPNIRGFLKEGDRLGKAGFHDFKIDADSALGGPVLKKVPSEKAVTIDIVEFSFRFEVASPPGHARAIARLSKDPIATETQDQWKAYIVYTALESIEGHEPPETPHYGHYEGNKMPS